ncbi:hypothetical protein CLRAG_38700 [Clostridium ragsdalei P11]|uniref:O-antigen ligase-related domain-containing protein n=1 Tax=Clostridium ragsdalei P11 TaxID=1353534 RepID=A0A1A6AIN7_9CLOT|nr:O-antigen ligase family protein [Clostridium ragsdalei]OBR89893.1 hypothetical protein CLRAG_38700 [Clostridium ragsdalei P11]
MKLQKQNVFLFIFLLAAVPPYYLTKSSILKYTFDALQILGVLYMIFVCILKGKISHFFIVVLSFDLILIIVTSIGGQSVFNCLTFIIKNLIYVLLIMIYSKRNAQKFLKVSYDYFTVICLINFIYLLYGCFVLGKTSDDSLFITESNSITSPLIYSVVVGGLYNIIYGEKQKILSKRLFLLLICITITELLVWSATGMVGWFILLVYIFYVEFTGRIKSLPYFKLSVVAVLLNISIVFFNIQDKLSFLIECILQKSLTFTGRTYIWKINLEQIRQSWIIGYGYGYRAVGFFYAHNAILEFLIEGGIVLLVAFIWVVVIVGLKNKKDNQIYSSELPFLKASQFLIIAVFSFEIMMITELPSVIYFFSILELMYCLPYLLKSNTLKKG